MAKLYRTSGTGNAQQTLDVNDEKIKIYADETSLDADLANIGENEIVATNEEDSQRAGTQYPVDVVQDGNMNAVTSNAVADAISYSTTEQKTGGTWIDGKPIYRKVLNIGTLPNNTEKQVAHNITNLGIVLNIHGFAKGLDIMPIPYVSSSANTGVQIYMNGSSVFVVTGSDRTSYTICYLVMEYTKTTD